MKYVALLRGINVGGNKSGMHKFIGTKIYKLMTARNVNTFRKLNELMKSS